MSAEMKIDAGENLKQTGAVLSAEMKIDAGENLKQTGAVLSAEMKIDAGENLKQTGAVLSAEMKINAGENLKQTGAVLSAEMKIDAGENLKQTGAVLSAEMKIGAGENLKQTGAVLSAEMKIGAGENLKRTGAVLSAEMKIDAGENLNKDGDILSIEVVIGRAGSGKTFACLKEMQKILAAAPFQTEIVFLLPAYQTYRAELELAAICGGTFNTWISSFQRFARQILAETGGSVIPRISDTGRRLLLRKILLDRAKDLHYYRRAANQRGFVENLAQELQELRTYSIDAAKLAEIAENLTDAELQSKIHDLALLYNDFRAAIANLQNDESDLLEQAAAAVKNLPNIHNTEIFIDGFIFFDPQQRNFLREIFKYARNVHITLPMDTDLNSRENVREIGLFNRSFRTLQMIRQLAEVPVKIASCNEPARFENDALRIVERNFFNRKPEIFAAETDAIKILEAVNKRVEVEAVARDILRLHKKGWRFREIGIISRDATYGDLIKPIFEIHGIPFFVDSKRPAANHPLAELIRSAMEILRGWRAEAIFRCLRTGFFNVAQDEIDLLENYVLEFGLRGKKVWAQTENWHWHRHRLEDSEENISAAETERLEKIDSLRREIIAPILKFADAASKKNPARHFATAIFNLLENLRVYDKLSDWAALEESRGNLAESAEQLKIWNDAVVLLEQIVDALDEDSITAREFELIINEGLDALQMSLIPPGLDEVTVSGFDQNSLQNSRAIYVLGFSDSNFPKPAREKNLLSDADRLHLNDAQLELPKGGSDAMLAEKFLVYRGLTSAKNYLHISYPLADSEGNAMRPAAILDKFKIIFPKIEVATAAIDILDSLGSEIEFATVAQELTPKTAAALYAPNKKMRGTVTNLETFNKCPFQYFANYGLKLAERREYKVTPPDIGSLLHAVMSQFGERLKSQNRRWASVDAAELEKIVTEILDNLAPNLNNKILFSSNALQHQRDRIKKLAITSLERLIKFDAASKFHPNFFEQTFGAKDVPALIYDIAGVKMELAGKIDRIDFSEDGKYFLIIDYKTGSAYLNLTEIFTGVNLQLLTYLMVADNLDAAENRAPAGMMYYFLKFPVKVVESAKNAGNEVNKLLKLAGWTLDDAKVIREIDGTDNLDFLKVQLNNDGSIKGNTRNYVKSKEQFDTMIKFIEEILRKTGEKILQGDIQIKPFKGKSVDACKYCAYNELCRKSDGADKIAELDDNKILADMEKLKTGLD